ncbi:MAG: DUF4065 domain-containing protein [Patescibacteria group bacterium]|nr:DUF4065 domain-containing protein [Patescibacteria group bacterium]
MLSKFIQQARKKNNFTQEYIASQLKISRPTYAQIEQGERDLTIPEAQKLADIFGLSMSDFLCEKEAMQENNLENEKFTEIKNALTVRINIPQKNLEKFREVLLYILSRIGSRPNVGETVIYKLLYFIDFDFYEKFEEQLIGATYIKNHYGPTPIEFKIVVERMLKNKEIIKVNNKFFNYPQRKYLPMREPDLTKLKDARELHHIDEVLARLGDKNATELSAYSHEDVPWIIAKKNGTLEYESVFYRTSKTSVRNYDEPD